MILYLWKGKIYNSPQSTSLDEINWSHSYGDLNITQKSIIFHLKSISYTIVWGNRIGNCLEVYGNVQLLWLIKTFLIWMRAKTILRLNWVVMMGIISLWIWRVNKGSFKQWCQRENNWNFNKGKVTWGLLQENLKTAWKILKNVFIALYSTLLQWN